MGPRPRSSRRLHPARPTLGASRRASRCPTASTGPPLFADISGFTPLTEALAKELGPQRGAEELTANIGRVFHAVIDELDAYDGNVIYFAGDAITCWIDGDDGSPRVRGGRGHAGGDRADRHDRDARREHGRARDEGGDRGRRRAALRRRRSGHPADRRARRPADGRPRRGGAPRPEGRDRARSVGDRGARRPRRARPSCGATRTRTRPTAVFRGLLVDVEPKPGRQPAALPEELVRPWLLPAVYERMRTGRGEFLAELRPAIPVFVRFGGIDYDNDDDAIEKLDEFVRGGAGHPEPVRRQRPAADARRQGRLPVRRLRLAARPRGRRGARGRGRPRAARPREDRPRRATSRSGSPTAASGAARTATRCGGRSSASAMR